jgi:hypothetical protein
VETVETPIKRKQEKQLVVSPSKDRRSFEFISNCVFSFTSELDDDVTAGRFESTAVAFVFSSGFILLSGGNS